MYSGYNDKDRKDFLLKLYETLNKEIDRHINSTWQIIGVIVSGFAVFALVEKKVLPLDFAVIVIVLICGIGMSYVIEANYWYNRNLVIIANIERQFLFDTDQRDIHWYFATHRKDNEMLDMMIIQLIFIGLFSLFIIVFHFFEQVYPGFSAPLKNIEVKRSLPYLIVLLVGFILFKFYKKRINDFNKFKARSPGISITPMTSLPGGDHPPQ
jgi:hypothetical protein